MKWMYSFALLWAIVVLGVPPSASAQSCMVGNGAPCVLPGVTLGCDPTGDFDAQLGSVQDDIVSVSMADPGTPLGTPLVATLKVASLDPDSLPVGHIWRVWWTFNGTRYFVSMTTCDVTQQPGFDYGFVDAQGVAASQGSATAGVFSADGTIQITISKSLVGNPSPGAVLSGVQGTTAMLVGAQCTGVQQQIDVCDASLEYTVQNCPLPPTPPESPCILPGVLVATDDSGDNTGEQPEHDALGLWIAEPYQSDGVERITFTLKVTAINPSALTPNSYWYILYTVPGVPDTTYFVFMNTCSATRLPNAAFGWGYVDASTNNLRRSFIAAAQGQVTADGQIRITMPKYGVFGQATGFPAVRYQAPVGATLTGILGDIRVLVGANCTGLVSQLDATNSITDYLVRGHNYCKPPTVSCPTPIGGGPGTYNRSFSLTNPSTTARSFDVTLEDQRGWLVGGSIETTLGPVAAGGTTTLQAMLQMAGPCNPPVTDQITWSVTGVDLEPSVGTASCATVDTCRSTTGVGESADELRFAVVGSNPFHGSTQIAYTLAERGRVRLEIFSVTGQRVRTLVDAEQEAGQHSERFALRGDGGRELPAGVYLARLTAGERVQELRLVGLD